MIYLLHRMKSRICLLIGFHMFVCICLSLSVSVSAQTPEDIEDFMNQGREAYKKGDLQGAAIEFENVVLIDSGHFEAQLWLAQVYTDLKDLSRARSIMARLRKNAADHPRVIELAKLLDVSESKKAESPKDFIPPKNSDPLIAETMAGLASATRLRPFGLVVPVDKVAKSGQTNDSQDEIEEIDLSADEDPPPEFDLSSPDEQGPLGSVFKLRREKGLAAALDEYFGLLSRNRDLASENDENLLSAANEIYREKLDQDSADEEARYYLGMIAYYNGQIIEAAGILEPLKNDAKQYRSRLSEVFAQIDAVKKAEEERRLELERERERLEAERIAAIEAAKAADSPPDQNIASSTSSGGGEEMHDEAYALYKRGQIDAAIEKFNEAIRQNADEPKYHFHLGLALTDKGLAGDLNSFDSAITSFNKVIQLSRGSKMAQDAETMIRDIVSAKSSLTQ